MSNEINDIFQEKKKRINQLALKQVQSNEKLKKIYLKTLNSGIYNYISNIPNINKFSYFIIFFILFYVINLINFSLKHVIIIVGLTIIIFFLNDKRLSTSITRMQEIELKLNGIFPKPKYFYIDSGIIELIHSIKEYKNYNSLAFNKLISILDNFLKLSLDIEKNPTNSYALYEVMQHTKNAALNNLHSFIYNIPSDKHAEIKLSDAMDSLHYILNFHLEKIRVNSNTKYLKDDPNINNKYINSNMHPEGSDPYINNNFDFY